MNVIYKTENVNVTGILKEYYVINCEYCKQELHLKKEDVIYIIIYCWYCNQLIRIK